MQPTQIILVNGKKRSGKDFFTEVFLENSDDFEHFSIARSLKLTASHILGIHLDDLEDYKNAGLCHSVDKELYKNNFRIELEHMAKILYPDGVPLHIMKNIFYFKPEQLSVFKTAEELKVPDELIMDDIAYVDARLFLQHMNVFKILFENDNIWIDLTIQEIAQGSDNYIISDFRFPNECSALEDYFGLNNVTTVKIIGKNYYDHDEYDNHASERSLDDFKFDYHVNNTIWDSESLKAQAQALNNEVING